MISTMNCLQSSESYKLSMKAGAPASCQMVEEKKKNVAWHHYDDFLYRIIQEIFINLIFVKFIDSSPLSWPHLLYPFYTDDSCNCACCKYFYFL